MGIFSGLCNQMIVCLVLGGGKKTKGYVKYIRQEFYVPIQIPSLISFFPTKKTPASQTTAISLAEILIANYNHAPYSGNILPMHQKNCSNSLRCTPKNLRNTMNIMALYPPGGRNLRQDRRIIFLGAFTHYWKFLTFQKDAKKSPNNLTGQCLKAWT